MEDNWQSKKSLWTANIPNPGHGASGRRQPQGGDGQHGHVIDLFRCDPVLSHPELRRRHDFELTVTAPPSRVAPEPLFASPAWQGSTSTRWSRSGQPALDEIIAEMFAMIDSAFDSW
jgi:hypothetical protein